MTTLFVAWQAPGPTRAWFPIGRLDADTKRRVFLFRYTRGALQAQKDVGFEPLIAFPDFNARYESSELFPLFRNRVLEPSRRDFAEYLHWLDLDPARADPIEILALSGGERQTDSIEVFPKATKRSDGSFVCRFFLHGLRHVSPAAQARAETLKVGEALQIAIEVNNPATGYAVQLQTADCHLIGWAPRYLLADLLKAVQDSNHTAAKVVRVNEMPAPIARRILIELVGHLPGEAEPMASEEYKVIA